MDALVEGVNATGTFLVRVLEPVPVDLVMIVFTVLAAWVWYENLRAWARKRREERRRERTFVGFTDKED